MSNSINPQDPDPQTASSSPETGSEAPSSTSTSFSAPESTLGGKTGHSSKVGQGDCPCGDQTRPGHPIGKWCERGVSLSPADYINTNDKDEFDPSIPFRNARWEVFLQNYMNNGLNATLAYIETGYSRDGASAGASQLLANPKVRARLNYLLSKRAERLSLTSEKVLRETAILSFSDNEDYEKLSDGRIRVKSGVDPSFTRAIKGVRFKTRKYFDKNLGVEVIEEDCDYSLWDKNRALELAARHLGIDKTTIAIENPKKSIAEVLGLDEKDLPE